MRFRAILVELIFAACTAAVAIFVVVIAYSTRPIATFGLTPQAVVGELTQFYSSQRNPQTGRMFRWSAPGATLDLPRPGEQSIVSLDLASGQTTTVPVTITSGAVVSQFGVAPELRRYHLLVPGDADATRLRIAVAGALAPQTVADERPRSVVLYNLSLAGDGRAPFGVELLGAATALTTLAALRISRMRRSVAVAIVLAGATVRAVSLAFGAWQIWWLAEQFALFSVICLAALAIRAGLRRFGLIAPHPAWHVLVLCFIVLPLRFVLVPMPDPIGDLNTYFLDWARWARSHDLSQLYASGSNYPPIWPLVLGRIGALADFLNLRFTAPLPLPSALLLKLPAMCADLGLSLVVYWYALRWRPALQAFGIASMCGLLPPFWIDSAWWGQIDTIPILLVVLAFVLFQQQHGLWSWALFALALLVKAQLVVFAPLICILALRRHGWRWLLSGALVASGVFALVCAPLIAAGQLQGLRNAYFASVERYPYVSMHGYNIWELLTAGRGNYDWSRSQPGIDDRASWLFGLSHYRAGLALIGSLTIGVCCLLWRRYDREGATLAALLLGFGFYMLPTQMHERYVLPVLPFLLLWWAHNNLARWPLAVLTFTTTLTLFRSFPLWPAAHAALTPAFVPILLACANLVVLIWFGWYGFQLWHHQSAERGDANNTCGHPAFPSQGGTNKAQRVTVAARYATMEYKVFQRQRRRK